MPDYRNLRPRLLWGASFANALDVGYPLDGAVTYSEPREPSEVIQLISGVEDSSILDEDHYLAGTVRWIPQEDENSLANVRVSGWNGTRGWRNALHWLRAKNVGIWNPDSRNVVRYPYLNTGTGTATGWTDEVTSAGGTPSVVTGGSGYQQIARGAGPGAPTFHTVLQVVPGFRTSEQLTLSVDCEAIGLSGGAYGYFGIQWRDAAGSVLSISDTTFTGGAARRSLTATSPLFTDSVTVVLSLFTPSGATGTVRYSNVCLGRGTSQTFVAGVESPFYLVEPFRDPPGLELLNARRTLSLLLRSSDGVAFEGY